MERLGWGCRVDAYGTGIRLVSGGGMIDLYIE